MNAEELTAWVRGKHAIVNIIATLAQGRPSSVEVVQETGTQTGTKVSIALGGAAVDVTAMNNKAEQSDSAKLYRIRFLTSDRDKNGYLNEMEYASVQLPAPYFFISKTPCKIIKNML